MVGTQFLGDFNEDLDQQVARAAGLRIDDTLSLNRKDIAILSSRVDCTVPVRSESELRSLRPGRLANRRSAAAGSDGCRRA